MGLLLGFTDRKTTGTHTHIGLWARHTMIDIQSLRRVSYQTVSMPPSEVILQLRSTGMQNIRNTSWNFSVHNLNLTKPHSLPSGACKIKIFNGGTDALWCLVNVERLTSPLRGARPEEVIMRSPPVLLSTYDDHFAGWRFFLGMRLVPCWGLERVSRVWTSINRAPRAVTSFFTPQNFRSSCRPVNQDT